MYAECQLESIQHIHALRTELENSLISDDSPIDSERRQQQLRQLRTVFRSDEAVHIQFSGPIIEEEQQQQTSNHQQNIRPPSSSRFTVSPTPPNALPSFASSIENRKQALHVLITKPIFEKEGKKGEENKNNKKIQTPNSIVVPPPQQTSQQSTTSASSPASSIDSGVASPGSNADEFLLFAGNNSPFCQLNRQHRNSLPNPLGPFESQTLPKARGGRVFNFTTTTTTNKCDGGGFSSLIEALSLLPGAHINDEGECKTNRGEDKNKGGYVNNKPFELQNPPIGKSYNRLDQSSTTSLLLQKFNAGIGEKRKEEGDGLPPRSATMPPLKSILKKKQQSSSIGASNPSLTTTMPTPLGYSNQRKGGMFSRFVPFRSISEDHQDEQRQRSPPLYKYNLFSNSNKTNNVSSSPTDFSTSTSSSNGTIEEEEIDSGIADCFYCSSGNINKNEINQQQQKQQKRVSFSEQVQARVYRSTSSILGQRKKNEKKARSRATRRCNSDESETTTTNSFDVTTNDEFKRSYLGIYKDNLSTNNSGNIVCKSMVSSTSDGTTNGANSGGGMSVLAQ
uniref:Uncharacterized protein n=1 Tax=Meloidogyne enterolobii TaxID=390850 RepID=A0A6V7WR78_MELEN|nr:unnamed protein product [Meloidogyne enterolobii]